MEFVEASRQDWRPSETIMTAAGQHSTSSPAMTEYIIKRYRPPAAVTERVLLAMVQSAVAAGETMRVLLRLRRDEVVITDRVFAAIARDHLNCFDVLETILQYLGRLDVVPQENGVNWAFIEASVLSFFS